MIAKFTTFAPPQYDDVIIYWCDDVMIFVALSHFLFRDAKKTGPPFATTAGKGLAIGSAPAPVLPPPMPMCPKALELRQLLQYEPISDSELALHESKLTFFS